MFYRQKAASFNGWGGNRIAYVIGAGMERGRGYVSPPKTTGGLDSGSASLQTNFEFSVVKTLLVASFLKLF